MTSVRKSRTPLLLAGAALLLLAGIGVVSIAAETRTNGTVELYGEKSSSDPTGELLCTFDLVNGTHDFTDMECPNDEAEFFKLVNAPSATVISFHDSPKCEDKADQNFYMYLKTVQKNVTFEKPLELKAVIGTPVNDIVQGSGGVRMEKKYEVGQVHGKMSCLKIVRSAVPD